MAEINQRENSEIIDSEQAKKINETNVAKLEVIFKDSESSIKPNKELIQFFKNNIDTLNKDNIKFIMRIVSQDEQKLYKQRGIKSLPALIIPNGNIFYGVREIIKEIGNFANQRKKLKTNMYQLANGMAEVSEEALYEFQRRAIGSAKDEDNPDIGDNAPDFRSKEMEMMRRRQRAGMHTNLESAPAPNGDPYKVNLNSNDADNIPMKISPSDSLQRMRRQEGVSAADADLLQMQLDKMDGLGSMDYF